MKQPRTARGGDLEGLSPVLSPVVTPTRDRVSATERTLPGPTSDLTVSAIDRLVARIESGTATPEDVDDLPEGVVEYMHAALALNEMGVLGADWEVTPTGGILVRGPAR